MCSAFFLKIICVFKKTFFEIWVAGTQDTLYGKAIHSTADLVGFVFNVVRVAEFGQPTVCNWRLKIWFWPLLVGRSQPTEPC